MSFLIATFEPIHRLPSLSDRLVGLRALGWTIDCWRDRNERVAAFWKENDGRLASFVCVFGWCDISGQPSAGLCDSDCREMLRRHRDGSAPLTNRETGGFVAIV